MPVKEGKDILQSGLKARSKGSTDMRHFLQCKRVCSENLVAYDAEPEILDKDKSLTSGVSEFEVCRNISDMAPQPGASPYLQYGNT